MDQLADLPRENCPIIVPILDPYECWITEIWSTIIPSAHDSLFTRKEFKAGEILGEIGGRLYRNMENIPDDRFIVPIPPDLRPMLGGYSYLDSQEFGGHASKCNFAPRKVNGIDTNMQNCELRFFYKKPYIAVVATKDIPLETECFMSYGANYDYSFMDLPEVRDAFCEHLKLDSFDSWEP